MDEANKRPHEDNMNQRLSRREFLGLSAFAGVSLLAVACGPVTGSPSGSTSSSEVQGPPGFPVPGIEGTTPVFRTGNKGDAAIPQSEITDPVGPAVVRNPGSVDGIPNPPGTVNVLVSGQEAWMRADENGYPIEGSIPFK